MRPTVPRTTPELAPYCSISGVAVCNGLLLFLFGADGARWFTNSLDPVAVGNMARLGRLVWLAPTLVRDNDPTHVGSLVAGTVILGRR